MRFAPTRYVAFLGYVASTALLHSVVRSHYAAQCTPSWLAGLVTTEVSPYCELVRRCLSGLQLSAVAAVVVPRLLHPPE
jgi:hypothetical protein